jgi:hypothetical protein
MTAIVYGFVRATTRESNLVVITAFCIAGIVLTLASAHFGLDVDRGILS